MDYFLTWQDLVLMLGGFGFSVALIPMVRQHEKPPISASLPTVLILIAFGAAYATLGLWLAFLSGLFTCTMWLILLIQKLRRKDNA